MLWAIQLSSIGWYMHMYRYHFPLNSSFFYYCLAFNFLPFSYLYLLPMLFYFLNESAIKSNLHLFYLQQSHHWKKKKQLHSQL